MLPGTVRSQLQTNRGVLSLSAFPAAGASSIASETEIERMARVLAQQNPPTYGKMEQVSIRSLLPQHDKSLFVLSSADDPQANGRRAQINLQPKQYPAEGPFPSGSYLEVTGLVSNANASGLLGGGTPAIEVAKKHTREAGALGLRLYTDTPQGVAFYRKCGFRAVRIEPRGPLDSDIRTHMGWVPEGTN